MSDALRNLRKQSRELEKLLKDIHQCEREPTSLDSAVAARHSLGEGVQVTRWVLIEHFLFSVVEWSQLYARYFRYFGQSEDAVPNRWRNLRNECDQIRQRVLVNSAYDDLPDRLSQEWFTDRSTDTREQNGLTTVEELYDEFVQSDVRQRTASIYSWQPLTSWDLFTGSPFPSSANPGWQNLADDLRGREQSLQATYQHAERPIQDEIRQFIRNYRHATLRVSWLEENGQGTGGKLLFSIDKRERHRMSALGDFLDDLMQEDVPDNLYQIVDRVLGRIADAVHEVGYDNFAADISSKDFLGGDDSPLGSSDINLIPGEGSSKCCPALVAISRGSSRRAKLGFPKILQQVKVHLTECAGITRAVIVLCDTWDAKEFMNEHFQELRAHHRKGVRFLFLMIGAPDTAIASVDVRL